MDTHKIVRLLQDKGYSEQEAEGFIQAIQEITLIGVASKEDLRKVEKTLRQEISQLDKKVDGVEKNLKQEIVEVKESISDVKQSVSDMKSWFMSILLTQTLAIIAFTFALFQFYMK